VKVDFGHKTSPLTEDHVEGCNEWKLASWAGLGWCLEKSVVGVYHSIYTAPKRQIRSCTHYEWRGGPKGCSQALLPFRGICCKPSLQNLVVMGFQQPVVVNSCPTLLDPSITLTRIHNSISRPSKCLILLAQACVISHQNPYEIELLQSNSSLSPVLNLIITVELETDRG
jgi:hypothetical protein